MTKSKFFNFLFGNSNKVNNYINADASDISSSTITINGKTVSGSFKNVKIRGNKVIVDGVDVTPETKDIKISISGNVDSLSVDACNSITITGDSGSVKTMSGNVDIGGNVSGDVGTMSGNVKCGDVGGSVKTTTGNIRKN